MAFNELNVVEHYIIHQVSGVNVAETNPAYGITWQYKSAQELGKV